jgi:hypothetical protein
MSQAIRLVGPSTQRPPSRPAYERDPRARSNTPLLGPSSSSAPAAAVCVPPSSWPRAESTFCCGKAAGGRRAHRPGRRRHQRGSVHDVRRGQLATARRGHAGGGLSTRRPRMVQRTVQGAELGIRDLERSGITSTGRATDASVSGAGFGGHLNRFGPGHRSFVNSRGSDPLAPNVPLTGRTRSLGRS